MDIIFHRRCGLRISRLIASSLTWGNCGLCGEIHELLKSGDITRARKLIKDDPSLVIRKAEDGSRLCTS
jgi:hypothetical protein